jgi:hypothetical protein
MGITTEKNVLPFPDEKVLPEFIRRWSLHQDVRHPHRAAAIVACDCIHEAYETSGNLCSVRTIYQKA